MPAHSNNPKTSPQQPEKRTLSPAAVEYARIARDALDAALKVAESDIVDPDELGPLPAVTVLIDPPTEPSTEVREAVAASKAAREKFARETDAARTAALILAVGAEFGKMLIPFAGPVSKLAGLCLVLAIGMGLLWAPVGCRAPEIRVDADVPTRATLASPEAHLAVGSDSPVAQPAASHVGDTTAGRDVRVVPVTITASGSAWPIVATVALLVAGLAAVAWIRANQRSDRLQALGYQARTETMQRAKDLRGNTLAVARAISKMPAGAERDGLLKSIREFLPNLPAWDRLVQQHGHRVHRRPWNPPAPCGEAGCPDAGAEAPPEKEQAGAGAAIG